jgi:GntR family transcriptional regulator, rspAB operon transcriptional repressor
MPTPRRGIGSPKRTESPVLVRSSLVQREPFSLAEHAYDLIRERILKGQIPLGAELSRRTLAKEMGIGLLPIAEALQRLENEELVESRPRVGTRVRRPTPDEIRQHYQVREALESQAARLFAERATRADRATLERMAERMDALFNQCASQAPCDREFLYAVQSYHFEFHLWIAEGGNCPALKRTIEKNHVLIFNWLFDVAAQRPPLPPRFHRDLAAAINSADPEAADEAMRAHIRYGINTVVTGIDPSAARLETDRPR